MKISTVLFLAGLLAIQVPLAVNAVELKVVVNSLSNAEGKVYLRVWDSEKTWLKTQADMIRAEKVISADAQNSDRKLEHSFDLPAGEYAVAVFHDIDGDGELKTNFMGRPVEPIGNTARKQGRMGPPKYEDSVIVLGDELKILNITLR
ncbi:MAG: hypothetical protein ACI93R_001014 [Flavobacteriales bacterium]|jgi:uncharacterized protein (DUF2141 family)